MNNNTIVDNDLFKNYKIRSTEHLNSYNKIINKVSQMLYEARRIEFMMVDTSEKWHTAKPLLDNITNILKKKHNYVLHRPLWEELHDRYVYYYDYLNKINLNRPLPLFRMTMHNEASDWWIRCKSRGILQGPLIHFDTHDDMNIETPAAKNQECNQINHPVTCAVLYGCANQVIWAMPKWIHDSNMGFDQVLVRKGNTIHYLRSENSKTDKFILDDDVLLVPDKKLKEKSLKKYDYYTRMRFDRQHIDTPEDWKILRKIIKPKRGKENTLTHFILDIDLDFFAANGDKISLDDYLENFDDVESYGRVHGLPGIYNPRKVYIDEIETTKALQKEEKHIKARIKRFLKGLTYLKRNGITPCVINISDSCASLFSGSPERAIYTNEYTPKYFVPFMYSLLIPGFIKLYNDVL